VLTATVQPQTDEPPIGIGLLLLDRQHVDRRTRERLCRVNSTSAPIGRKPAARKARGDWALPGVAWGRTGASTATSIRVAISVRP
jgi:hypothetical protein